MVNSARFGALLAGLTLALGAAWAQEVIVYPAKGQSAEQTEKDKFECYQWFRLAAAPVHDAHVGPDIGIIGIQLQRFAVGVDGFLILFGIEIGVAQFRPGDGIVGLCFGPAFEGANQIGVSR